jgi:uncharacterized membrane protein YkoI
MGVLKSNAVPFAIILLLGPLVLDRLAQSRVAETVVPIGTLAHAAEVFQEDTGGKVLEIRLADTAGAPGFEAALLKNGGVLYMRIASPDAHVTKIDVKNLPPWLLNYHLEAYSRSAVKAEVPIQVAIAKAEKRNDAPAIDAGIAKPLSGDNAVLAYFVETLNGSRREDLAVDATTGAFVENPESLFETHTPVELARRLAP